MNAPRVKRSFGRSNKFAVRVSTEELRTIYKAAELSVRDGTSETAGSWARHLLLTEARAQIARSGK